MNNQNSDVLYSMNNDGIAIFNNYLNSETLKKLKNELNGIFLRPTINGRFGCIRLWHKYEKVTIPVPLVKSVNLLELALDVMDKIGTELSDFNYDTYRIVDIFAYKESANPKPLFWHTDERYGMIRAQLYIEGGQDDSGAFQFMRGTHRRDYWVLHEISDERTEKLKDKIVTCVAPEGSLVAFDSFGFHAKSPCVKTRINLMIEFQPTNNMYTPPKIMFSSQNLSKRVLENIHVFSDPNSGNYRKKTDFIGYERALPISVALGVVFSAASNFVWRAIQNIGHKLKSPFVKINDSVEGMDLTDRYGYKQWLDSQLSKTP